MKISPQISQSVRWFFKIDFSPTANNLFRLFAQITTLTITGLAFYKAMTSRSCSITSISNAIKRVINDKISSQQAKQVSEFERIFPGIKTDFIDVTPFKGVDLYRSETITFENLTYQEKIYLGQCILAYFNLKKNDQYLYLKEQFCDYLQTQRKLTLVDLSISHLKDGSVYCMVDLVERETRLIFTDVPDSGTLFQGDPGNLLQECDNFYSLRAQIRDEGVELNVESRAYHGLKITDHPDFSKLEEKFKKDVPLYKNELKEICLKGKDKDIPKVLRSIFLVTYLDGKEAVETLKERIFDVNTIVRNAVLVVFANMAENTTISLPEYAILKLLDHPFAYTREKAAYILYHLLKNNTYSGDFVKVITEKLPILDKFAELKNPRIKELATGILKILEKNYQIKPSTKLEVS
ncbi:MAG: hypothetical protein L0207_03400 [Chlamydiae bacterium]|nr:hypothetical protein [Chlamydiota bacterium]